MTLLPVASSVTLGTRAGRWRVPKVSSSSVWVITSEIDIAEAGLDLGVAHRLLETPPSSEGGKTPALTGRLAHTSVEPDCESAVRKALVNRPELFRGELDMRLQEAAQRCLVLPTVHALAPLAPRADSCGCAQPLAAGL